MAVSLSVVGSFAGVKTIPAAEEMSTTDISLYQEENQTQEKIEVQTETSPQLETSAAITESPQSESIQPESTQPESSTSLETESTIETASEHEETTLLFERARARGDYGSDSALPACAACFRYVRIPYIRLAACAFPPSFYRKSAIWYKSSLFE